MGMSILLGFEKPGATETFSFSKIFVIYKDSVMIFMGMKSFRGTLLIPKNGLYVNFIGTCDKPIWMEQRHVEIPPKRLYNDHTDKMDEMSMLTLCKLVINHYGWTRGMVKYPQNASGMAI